MQRGLSSELLFAIKAVDKQEGKKGRTGGPVESPAILEKNTSLEGNSLAKFVLDQC
jgi:hypothetical protein